MLVLSRQIDENIIIGDKIVVTIVDIRGDKVRLGIQAPVEIPVHRREVFEASKLKPRDSGKLENSVSQTTAQVELDPHQQISEYLKIGNYSEVYKMHQKDANLLTRDELSTLTFGLGNKLQQYLDK
jgi:carbon storage regulator